MEINFGLKTVLSHREDNPAIEGISGIKYYWYDGKCYSDIQSDEEWVNFIAL